MSLEEEREEERDERMTKESARALIAEANRWEARVRELTTALESLRGIFEPGAEKPQAREVVAKVDAALAAAGESGEERQATEQEVERYA